MLRDPKLPAAIAEEIGRLLGSRPAKRAGVDPQQTDGLRLTVQRAMAISDTMKAVGVGTEHLLLAMLQAEDDVGERLMKKVGVSYDDLHPLVCRVYQEEIGERRVV